MINIEVVRYFTAEEKTKWWGHGEWIDEPEEMMFIHNEYECKILRVAVKEPCAKEEHMFGGYLCGYVKIPYGHPYHHKIYEDMDIVCHFGLSFGEVNDGHWIGFDCGHSNDWIPSHEHLKKTAEWMKSVRENEERIMKFFNIQNSPFFKKQYRNMGYCIDQCKSIVDQLIEITKAAAE